TQRCLVGSEMCIRDRSVGDRKNGSGFNHLEAPVMKIGRNQTRRTAGLYMPVLFLLCSFAWNSAGLTAADAPKPVKACGLITPAEAGSIIGGPVGEPAEKFREFKSQKSWMSTCACNCESKGVSVAVTLTPIRSDLTGEKAYGQYVAGMEKSLGVKYAPAPVAGVGEKAEWDADMKQLIVFS
ncbi:MAG: hypothetical protein QUS35_04410, partial [bacterium]|nr:hypothetical protein [bacterium]